MPIDAQAQEYFSRHRRVWEQKPVLRRIYKEEFFARLLSFRKNDGVSVEVGAGPGFFKQTLPSVISTDIVWCPWLDAVADAQKLPFQSSTVANIFGVDMLHHLAYDVFARSSADPSSRRAPDSRRAVGHSFFLFHLSLLSSGGLRPFCASLGTG
jgi:hypothetical protein